MSGTAIPVTFGGDTSIPVEFAEVYVVEDPGGSGGNPDLTGYATEEWVQAGYQPKGEYLTTDALPTAIDTALAQAKESGEFDGAPGEKGEQGEKGEKGEQGDPGADGADYVLTDADKAEIAAQAAELVDVPETSTKSVYYIATDYGISTDAEDNTPALQTLVDAVSAAGGGIIFFPVGTYNFKKAATKYAVLMQSNVSILGENLETTVLRQSESAPYSMFYRMASASAPLTGCSFSGFTVDAYDTGNTNQVYGKAFFFQYARNCVFRDLRLQGTIATAMGIDYLDCVVIDNVTCIDCGRTYTGSQKGTSGIGVGTGGWEQENFIITNCVCVSSGQFGIFIENQYTQGWGGSVDYSKGCLIANCIVRGGLNNGIGVRGGENVTITGCEIYENANHGIYIDSKCKNVKVVSCSITANGASGAYLTPNPESSRIVIRGCTLVENTTNGITVANVADKLCIADNLTDENALGLYIATFSLNDCVLYGNAFLDGADISATFEGNTDYNSETNVEIVAPTAITADAIEVEEGSAVTVGYSVTPSNASKSVTFTSSDSTIAQVSNSGKVTGISAGSCNIVITSNVDNAVSVVVPCTVQEYVLPDGITLSVSDLTIGTKLGTTGAEETSTTSGVSGYVDVTDFGSAYVTMPNCYYGKGAAICEYDSEYNFVQRTMLYIQNATVQYDGLMMPMIFDESTRFIRLSVNDVTASNAEMSCYIQPIEIAVSSTTTVTSDNLIADAKLMPDGTTETLSGAYASDYVSVPEGASALVISGYGGNARLVTFDADKNVLAAYSSGLRDQLLEDVGYDMSGISFLRFGTSGNATVGTITLTWYTEL